MSILPNLSLADELWPSANPCSGRTTGLHERVFRGLAWSGAILADIVLWRLQRRAARELRALDDRMLKDIGIAREEIDHVVRRGRGSMPANNAWRRRIASI